jgi:hypothetical protein
MYICIPKIPMLLYFEGPWNENVALHILWPFGTFYGYTVYFAAVWNNLNVFGLCLTILVYCTMANLATLLPYTNAQTP